MPFIDTLIELRNGGAAIELEEGLEEVVQAVRATGKTGKLTLFPWIRRINRTIKNKGETILSAASN